MNLNPFDLVEKAINEHGSAVILRERLAQGREQFAVLELRIKELERQLADSGTHEQTLQVKLADARAEIKALKQKDEDAKKLTPEDISVLTLLTTARDSVHAGFITQRLNIAAPRGDYVLGRLVNAKYISASLTVPHAFKITQKGREAVFNPT